MCIVPSLSQPPHTETGSDQQRGQAGDSGMNHQQWKWNQCDGVEQHLSASDCQAMLRGDDSWSTAGHSEGCRRFIESCMEKDPELRERLLAARERQQRCQAEEIERGAAAAEPRPEVVEQIFEPADGVPVPDVDEEEPIPDVGDGLSPEG